MRTKFNPKIYQDKARVYTQIPNAPRLSRVWVWNENKQEYLTPPEGKMYLASRYENKKRVKKFFETLEEARNWQQGLEAPANPFAPTKKVNTTPLFSRVVEDWKKRGLVGTEQSTLRLYDRILLLHFSMLMDKHMDEITGKLVDQWLDELMNPLGERYLDPNRVHFRGEINLLRSILIYYRNSARRSYNHENWAYPLERDQVKRAKTKIRASKRDRSVKLSEEEFFIFRSSFQGKYSESMYDLSTVQFYCSLRISECAALHYEDIFLNFNNPSLSYMIVKRHIDWPRAKGVEAKELPGFKNSKHLENHTKKLAIFPEAFKVLAKIWKPDMKGLIFKNEDSFFQYRQIENAYNRAFKRAGLPFTGTHIMRHAGTTWVYNESKGDASLCQQQLGVKDMKTVATYVKRNEHALNEFAEMMWVKNGRED